MQLVLTHRKAIRFPANPPRAAARTGDVCSDSIRRLRQMISASLHAQRLAQRVSPSRFQRIHHFESPSQKRLPESENPIQIP
jgi:hypothetical protein